MWTAMVSSHLLPRQSRLGIMSSRLLPMRVGPIQTMGRAVVLTIFLSVSQGRDHALLSASIRVTIPHQLTWSAQVLVPITMWSGMVCGMTHEIFCIEHRVARYLPARL